MTREETRQLLAQAALIAPLGAIVPQERLATIKAYADGASIETRAKGNLTWFTSSSPNWDFTSWEYRVKQPACRPYSLFELVDAIHAHASVHIIHRHSQEETLISSLDFTDSALPVCVDGQWLTLKDLAEAFTWADGTPLGMPVDE